MGKGVAVVRYSTGPAPGRRQGRRADQGRDPRSPVGGHGVVELDLGPKFHALATPGAGQGWRTAAAVATVPTPAPTPSREAAGRVADLRALIVDWGGVLTSPLQDSMTAWCDADGIDYGEFRAVMKDWLGTAYGDDAAANPIHALERGEMDVPDFERELGSRLRTHDGRPVEVDGLLDPDVRRVRPAAADDRGGPPRQGGRAVDRAAVELVGQRLPARGLGRAVRRRRHLRRGRHAQARAGDLPADRAAGWASRPSSASSSTT